ncbi:MAG: hypothetical protein NZ483_05890 [Verrucomicrobiae bacterium]|nr:hypothetical protein [Verrucomicrobiae bacterium]MCS7048807.1 hypothetical protein [Verrucomicrobiae bacterium]
MKQAVALSHEEGGLFELLIAAEDNVFHRYDSTGLVVEDQVVRAIPASLKAETILPSGGQIVAEQIVSYWPDNVWQQVGELRYFAFPRPGKYLLKLRNGHNESAPITIAVHEPVGADLAAWNDILKTRYFPVFVQSGYVFDELVETELARELADGVAYVRSLAKTIYAPTPATVTEYARIAKNHPEAAYTQWLALALGKFYARRPYMERGHLTVKADAPQAQRYFSQAATMARSRWVRAYALLELANLQPPSQSIEICQQALREFPDSPLREEFMQRIKHIQSATQNPQRPGEIIRQTLQKLEEQRYDIRTFRQEHPERVEQWKELEMKIDLAEDESMDRARELAQQLAAVILHDVTTLARPLTEERWQQQRHRDEDAQLESADAVASRKSREAEAPYFRDLVEKLERQEISREEYIRLRIERWKQLTATGILRP